MSKMYKIADFCYVKNTTDRFSDCPSRTVDLFSASTVFPWFTLEEPNHYVNNVGIKIIPKNRFLSKELRKRINTYPPDYEDDEYDNVVFDYPIIDIEYLYNYINNIDLPEVKFENVDEIIKLINNIEVKIPVLSKQLEINDKCKKVYDEINILQEDTIKTIKLKYSTMKKDLIINILN